MSEDRGGVAGKLAAPARAVKGTAVGFAQGFRCLFRGGRIVYGEHRELWRYYVPPMTLALLALIGAFVLFSHFSQDVVSLIWAEPPRADWFGVKHVLWAVVSFLVRVVFAAASVVLSILCFLILAAPFNDALSERVEIVLGTWRERPFSLRAVMADIGHTLVLEIVRAAYKIAWLLPLLIVSLLVPVVGQVVYLAVGGYLLAIFTGFDYLDWCMARRGWTWSERLAFVKRHRFAVLGFGAAIVLSMMIPLAFVVAWPAAVAGGAVLFRSLGDGDAPRNGSGASEGRASSPPVAAPGGR